MHRIRKHIHTAHFLHLIPSRLKHLQISREAGRFAGDVDHLRYVVADDLLQSFRVDAVPWWVKHNLVRFLPDRVDDFQDIPGDELAVVQTV